MKISYDYITSESGKQFHQSKKLIMINILQCLTNNNVNLITDSDNYHKNGEMDIDIIINGVRIDVLQCLESLMDAVGYGQNDKILFQQQYHSKNSSNAKLEKVSKQLDRTKNILMDIEALLKTIK